VTQVGCVAWASASLRAPASARDRAERGRLPGGGGAPARQGLLRAAEAQASAAEAQANGRAA